MASNTKQVENIRGARDQKKLVKRRKKTVKKNQKAIRQGTKVSL